MKGNRKYLFTIVIGILIILVVLAYLSYRWYGCIFWQTFYTQSLATIFGVTLSALIALVIWHYQQKMQKEQKLNLLYDSLKTEINENLNRLADLENNLDQYKKETHHMIDVSMIMKGYNVAGISVQFLRTVAMTEFLKPENRLLIKDIQFEDNIEWVLWQSNIFNDNLSNALKEFEVGIDSGKTEAEAFPKFKSTVMQRFHFFLGFMHSLDNRLGGDFFYPKK